MQSFQFLLLFVFLVLPSVSADPVVAEVIFGRYPGYTGPLNVGGTLLMTGPGEQAIAAAGTLFGLEASVTGGWHIHVGKTCDNAAMVGGHLFPSGGANPWTTVTYSSTAAGTAVVERVINGLSLASALDHAVVVHAANGGRLACGLLCLVPPPPILPPFLASPSPSLSLSPLPPIPSTSPSPICCPTYRNLLPEVCTYDLGMIPDVHNDNVCASLCVQNPECKFWLRRKHACECYLSSMVPVSFASENDANTGPRCTGLDSLASPPPSISSSPSPSASPSPGGPGITDPSPSPSPRQSPELLNGCLIYPNTLPAEGIHQFAIISNIWSDSACKYICGEIPRCKFWVRRKESSRCYLGLRVPTLFKVDADATSGPQCPGVVICATLVGLPAP